MPPPPPTTTTTTDRDDAERASTSSTPAAAVAAVSAAITVQDGLTYLHGYGNHLESESIRGSLPVGRNNPRIVPLGLYTEQLSGTAFTCLRSANRRSWLYRIRPGVAGSRHRFRPCGGGGGGDDEGESSPQHHHPRHVDDEASVDRRSGSTSALDVTTTLKAASSTLPRYFGRTDWSNDLHLDPNPMRWGPTPLSSDKGSGDSGSDGGGGGSRPKKNFVQGMQTMMGSGDPTTKSGIAIYVYAFNENMTAMGSGGDSSSSSTTTTSSSRVVDAHMYNSDGDLLLVPQLGTLRVHTEFGILVVRPKEIVVLPRGVVFCINLVREKGGEHEDDDAFYARGYALEIFRGHFSLPELGPIGSNGLANGRDFLYPTAYHESDPSISDRTCIVVNKFGQRLFARISPFSPYNVVAWHGNYAPCKYNLDAFCAVNSVTYDHPDPSIYTVLTAKGDEDGTALADFVVFPPRVLATDPNTFRPPWFHRNVMSEYMGLIYGTYDAKTARAASSGGGFVPGGSSLHPIMTPHGPDADSYRAAVKDECEGPTRFEGGMAFMFESSAMCRLSGYALTCSQREVDYASCWDGLDVNDEFVERNRPRLREEERGRRGEEDSAQVDDAADGAVDGTKGGGGGGLMAHWRGGMKARGGNEESETKRPRTS